MNGVHHHEFFSITLRGLGMGHHLSIFGSFDLFEVTHVVSSRRFHRTINLEPLWTIQDFPIFSPSFYPALVWSWPWGQELHDAKGRSSGDWQRLLESVKDLEAQLPLHWRKGGSTKGSFGGSMWNENFRLISARFDVGRGNLSSLHSAENCHWLTVIRRIPHMNQT